MSIPFTFEQFLDVFRRYNEAVWPMPAVLIVLAIVAIVAAVSGGPRASKLVSLILAILWFWAGVAYHLTFFRDINPMAVFFAAAFIAESLLFVRLGVIRGALSFDARSGWSGIIGGSIIAYSLVAYPLIGHALGHSLPSAPTFGVPCPTTIFTFGLLIWMAAPRSKAILGIPVLWSAVGLVAAIELGMWEDLGLSVAAILAIAAAVWPSHRTPMKIAFELRGPEAG